MSLRTIRLKPNPLGKDRNRQDVASATQLGAEWVDLQGDNQTNVDLSDISLYHIAYSNSHPNGQWEQVSTFSGVLPAGKVMRVHTGSGPVSELRSEDVSGADFHVFTHKNYVWNNREGDCSGLIRGSQGQPYDRACYKPHPPEGEVLQRMGDALVVAGRAATA